MPEEANPRRPDLGEGAQESTSHSQSWIGCGMTPAPVWRKVKPSIVFVPFALSFTCNRTLRNWQSGRYKESSTFQFAQKTTAVCSCSAQYLAWCFFGINTKQVDRESNQVGQMGNKKIYFGIFFAGKDWFNSQLSQSDLNWFKLRSKLWFKAPFYSPL